MISWCPSYTMQMKIKSANHLPTTSQRHGHFYRTADERGICLIAVFMIALSAVTAAAYKDQINGKPWRNIKEARINLAPPSSYIFFVRSV